jgi:hypothetical protein
LFSTYYFSVVKVENKCFRDCCLETRLGRDRQSRGNGGVYISVLDESVRDLLKCTLSSLSSNSLLNLLVSSVEKSRVRRTMWISSLHTTSR